MIDGVIVNKVWKGVYPTKQRMLSSMRSNNIVDVEGVITKEQWHELLAVRVRSATNGYKAEATRVLTALIAEKQGIRVHKALDSLESPNLITGKESNNFDLVKELTGKIGLLKQELATVKEELGVVNEDYGKLTELNKEEQKRVKQLEEDVKEEENYRNELSVKVDELNMELDSVNRVLGSVKAKLESETKISNQLHEDNIGLIKQVESQNNIQKDLNEKIKLLKKENISLVNQIEELKSKDAAHSQLTTVTKKQWWIYLVLGIFLFAQMWITKQELIRIEMFDSVDWQCWMLAFGLEVTALTQLNNNTKKWIMVVFLSISTLMFSCYIFNLDPLYVKLAVMFSTIFSIGSFTELIKR